MALENSFPRGGKKLEVKKSLDLSNKRHKQKKKSKIQKGSDKGTEETFLPNIAHWLHNQDIQEEMTILGRVDTVKEEDMIVCLPGGTLGNVTSFDLSQSYSDRIRLVFSVDETDSPEPISNLYNPGDYVVCYVQKNKDREVCLSLDPHLINQNVSSSFLAKDAKIVCTIASVEENGYVIDTGVANVVGFLANENIDDGKCYMLGKQLFCVVKKIKTSGNVSIVQLSAKKRKIDKVSAYDTMFLDSVTPGTKLSLRIVKRVKNGFQVAFGEDNVGYVHNHYLDKHTNEYENGMTVTGMLLYVLPVVKLAYFSLLTNDRKRTFNRGDIVDNAEVLHVKEKEGITVRLLPSLYNKSCVRDESALGFVPRRQTGVPFDKISTTFAPGTTHKCRVIAYRWMEQLYLCSMEKHLLRHQFSVTDLKIGDVIDVAVIKTDKEKCIVRKGHIRGFVPPEHLPDDIFADLMCVGDKYRARVLNINFETSWVTFTLKSSLIESDLPILRNFLEAKCGSTHLGTVVKVRDTGSIVKFYGDAKGFLPHPAVVNDFYDHRNYCVAGQTVKVRVISIDMKRERLKLELVPEPEVESRFSVGEEVEGMITGRVTFGARSNEKHPFETFVVRIYRDGIYEEGFLPAGHLAPCTKLGVELMYCCEPRRRIRAVVFATRPKLLLTRTFIPQPEETRFDSLKVGDFILCSFHDRFRSNAVVVLPVEDYHRYGVASERNTSNFQKLKKNQLLYARIEAINKREKRLQLTMNLTDIWESTLESDMRINAPVSLLVMYFEKLEELRALSTGRPPRSEPSTNMELPTLGQKVSGIVTLCDDSYIEIDLCNGGQATVPREHCYGNCEEGRSVSGVVIWCYSCVYVSLLPGIINSISSKQDILPALPLGVTLRAKILMTVRDWFVLVLVKRNSFGYLACLPVRRHLNDISPDLTCYRIHAKVRVYCLTSRNESFVPICMLKSEFENLQIPREAVSEPSCGATKSKRLKRKKPSEEGDAYSSKKLKIRKLGSREDKATSSK